MQLAQALNPIASTGFVIENRRTDERSSGTNELKSNNGSKRRKVADSIRSGVDRAKRARSLC